MLAATQAVARDYPDETELLADIDTVRRARLTTLGRLIADPDVRRDFGFDFVGDDIHSTSTENIYSLERVGYSPTWRAT